jgi:hypothetical protein
MLNNTIKTMLFSFLLVLAIQACFVQSESFSESTDLIGKRSKKAEHESMPDELKTLRANIRYYVYYSDIVQNGMFSNQLQKKRAHENLQIVQNKLQHFINKYRNNKYMISQALQEYQRLMNNYRENFPLSPFAKSKKPFMWG